MAEMSRTGPHAPSGPWKIERPIHVAETDAATFAVALDPFGRLHFQGEKLSGDHVIVLVGPAASDSHLAELAADGVSYIVSADAELDIPSLLDVLLREFGITNLVVEGGARTNGAFLAAEVVDELRILVAPALDGAAQVQGIVEYRNGLAGVVKLQLKSAEVLDHGVVQLAYAVLSAGA
jgi:riboflavin biosynthesis pyrimidine reductase